MISNEVCALKLEAIIEHFLSCISKMHEIKHIETICDRPKVSGNAYEHKLINIAMSYKQRNITFSTVAKHVEIKALAEKP